MFRLDLIDLQFPRASKQRVPLLPGPFHRGHARHHRHVQLRGLPVDPRVRQHHVVDEDDGAFFHGRNGVLEDQSALLVGVVVEDVAHVVERGAWFERVSWSRRGGRLGRRRLLPLMACGWKKSCSMISTLSFVDGVGRASVGFPAISPCL